MILRVPCTIIRKHLSPVSIVWRGVSRLLQARYFRLVARCRCAAGWCWSCVVGGACGGEGAIRTAMHTRLFAYTTPPPFAEAAEPHVFRSPCAPWGKWWPLVVERVARLGVAIVGGTRELGVHCWLRHVPLCSSNQRRQQQ